jgi:NADP-dependent 3-hydroxy acid dehydrogenase YdfG
VGKLDDKVAVIGGASTGMGAATARLFAAEGATVIVAARSRDKLSTLVQDIRTNGGAALAIPLDATDREAVAGMTGRARSQFGGVDILVNSVGTNIKNRAYKEMEPEDWDMMIGHNLTVAYNLVDAVLPIMRSQGAGTIIHYSSDAVQKPNVVSGVAYQAAKHGVRGLAHGTMAEERDEGIRVSVIYPGPCETPLLDKRPEPPPPEAFAKMLQPEDVAEAALFIASLPPRAYVPELVLAASLM